MLIDQANGHDPGPTRPVLHVHLLLVGFLLPLVMGSPTRCSRASKAHGQAGAATGRRSCWSASASAACRCRAGGRRARRSAVAMAAGGRRRTADARDDDLCDLDHAVAPDRGHRRQGSGSARAGPALTRCNQRPTTSVGMVRRELRADTFGGSWTSTRWLRTARSEKRAPYPPETGRIIATMSPSATGVSPGAQLPFTA